MAANEATVTIPIPNSIGKRHRRSAQIINTTVPTAIDNAGNSWAAVRATDPPMPKLTARRFRSFRGTIWRRLFDPRKNRNRISAAAAATHAAATRWLFNEDAIGVSSVPKPIAAAMTAVVNGDQSSDRTASQVPQKNTATSGRLIASSVHRATFPGRLVNLTPVKARNTR